jgi:hypothetical protein
MEHVGIPAHPDGEATAAGPVGAATHRGVEYRDTVVGECRVDASHHRRRVGAEIEVGRPRSSTLDQAAVTQRDGLNLGGARQRREHDIAHRGDLGRRVLPLGTGVEVSRRRLTIQIVHDQRSAGGEQVRRHRRPHRAEPDESDDHVSPLLLPHPVLAATTTA